MHLNIEGDSCFTTNNTFSYIHPLDTDSPVAVRCSVVQGPEDGAQPLAQQDCRDRRPPALSGQHKLVKKN